MYVQLLVLSRGGAALCDSVRLVPVPRVLPVLVFWNMYSLWARQHSHPYLGLEIGEQMFVFHSNPKFQ